ncbi:hypothetical protein LR48_Vigan01g202900 [Vigna angularis]|uniref:Secreted protein n=1 Tax=Phaseolus angularis TaxID=3914 RepID=A0A0L9TPJ0_PHAAN|nr:hypothetical protein LR48_Vigan01g202900 [Vigna angularis]
MAARFLEGGCWVSLLFGCLLRFSSLCRCEAEARGGGLLQMAIQSSKGFFELGLCVCDGCWSSGFSECRWLEACTILVRGGGVMWRCCGGFAGEDEGARWWLCDGGLGIDDALERTAASEDGGDSALGCHGCRMKKLAC